MPPENERTLRHYLDAVAARTPAPGGGSVAAVAGAMAAALGEMVANLTLPGGTPAHADAALAERRDRLTLLRETLLTAAVADEESYAAYRQAAALPRGSETERAERAAAMERALIAATDVPLEVARAAAEVAKIMESVAREGKPSVRSDAALGALLAEVALRGALLNVRGNTALLADQARAQAYLRDADLLDEDGREAASRAYRLAGGDGPRDDHF
jgi:glutamate formiminotransferase/formiminotetrahydrofolate cyclodeaminase